MSDIRDPRKLYAQCVEQCADSLYRVAFRLTGSEAEARDLVQETFLQAWRSLDSLREVDRMRSWMFSILRNQHSKLVRKDSKLACSMISQVSGNQDNDLSLAELAVSSSLESDERLEREEERQQLQSAIDQLDETQKLPLLLVSMEGLSVMETAEALDVPKGTVLSRLHRARNRLKELVQIKSTS